MYPKIPASHIGICLSIFIVALFIITRNWKQPTCPSIDELIIKMLYIYAVDSHLPSKYEIIKFPGKLMEF